MARGTARYYRALLWLYPPSMRREYDDDMAQLFRGTLRHEVARAGPPGALRAWGDALADLAASLPREWPRELGRLWHWRGGQAPHRVITHRVNGVVVGHTVLGELRGRGRRMNNDKFVKFTERARKVLSLSQEEAQRFNHNYIGTEHLLLGLVRERDGVAAKVLDGLGVELDKVRNAVEFIIGRGDRLVLGELGLTPRAKKVIELAIDEAQRLNHHYIGTEHILLGLVREGEGIAAGVLESLGVNLEKLRAETIQVLGQGDPGASRQSARSQTRPRPDLGALTRRPTLGRITLSCRDAGITARFYLTHFDASVSQIHGAAGDEQWTVRLPGGGSELILRALPEEASSQPSGASIELDIWVADVDLAWRTLKDSDVSDLAPISDSPRGRSFTVPDPDGRLLHVYTRATPPGV